MYIPALPRVSLPEPPAAGADLGHPSRPSAPELRRLQLSLYDAIASLSSAVDGPSRHLRRRDPLQSSNVTIGAVVGVLLGVFIVGTVFFCVRYHRSIRFSESRRRRRRRGRSGGGSSRGSKASTSSGSTTAAPAPAPPPAPPAPPPAAAAAG